MQHRPLLITGDAGYLDEICGLAAAHGIEVHVAADAEGARSRWAAASLVIVGEDRAGEIARARLGRRDGVVLLARPEAGEPWRAGVEIGAEHVVVVPEGRRWLMDRLAGGAEAPSRNGLVLAVMPTSGGAGASTFAAVVARCLAGHMRTALIDADPLGGGIEVLLGMEDADGLRWPDLAATSGRLPADALASALPEAGGVSVLSWTRGSRATATAEAVDGVLDAAVRGFDAVIVDCARGLDPSTDLVLARSAVAVAVSSTRVRSVVAAARLLPELRDRASDVRLVVRADGKGLGPDAIARCAGERESLRLPSAPRIPLFADSGELTSLRDPYGRACASFVWEWARALGRAA